MLNQFAIAVLAAAVLTSPLPAQMRGMANSAGVSVTPGFAGHSRAGFGPGHVHRGHTSGRGSILFPYPYDYYDGYDHQEPSAPQVLVLPTVSPTAPAPPPAPAAPLEPLLIEWQGDHFVRTTLSQKISENTQGAPDYSEKSKPGSSAPSSSVRGRKVVQPEPRELPPAVLAFRDGRQEELSNYTIMSGMIYSKSDYWATGAWTKKIQIADLDVPATLKLNQEHGLKFVLPSGPNEVVMRP